MNSNTSPTGAVMSERLRSFPNNFIYSGFVSGSSLVPGLTTRYTTSSAWSSSTYMGYVFDVVVSKKSASLNNNYDYRYDGLTVKCFASDN